MVFPTDAICLVVVKVYVHVLVLGWEIVEALAIFTRVLLVI